MWTSNEKIPLQYDKNKFVERNLAVSLESLAIHPSEFVDVLFKKFFHEYLWSLTNIITDSTYTAKDYTVKLLNPLIKNDNNSSSADKQQCTVIIGKKDYIQQRCK